VEVSALDDSGAQLSCVRADVIIPLALPKLGSTKLRGITDETVNADLVSLRIKMSGGRSSVPVCDKLNGPLILGSDVVDMLHTQMLKEHYASGEVRFVGHIIGSGQQRADPEKIAAVREMQPPQAKKQVRQIMGFFSYFRDYIPNFAELAKPLSDLTSKRIPTNIHWGSEQSKAFEQLKQKLCQATNESLQISLNLSRFMLIQVTFRWLEFSVSLLVMVQRDRWRSLV